MGSQFCLQTFVLLPQVLDARQVAAIVLRAHQQLLLPGQHRRVVSLYLRVFSWRRAVEEREAHAPRDVLHLHLPISPGKSFRSQASGEKSLYFPNEQCPRTSPGAPPVSDSAKGLGALENKEVPLLSPYQSYLIKYTRITRGNI